MSPSPEVLQLVASSAAPGPSGTSSSFPKSKLPLPNSIDQVMVPVLKDTCDENMDKQRSPVAMLGPQTEEKPEQSESGDSSKTQSDLDLAAVKEISSEGTVSDHHVSDQES